jgi:hypothetical protein
LAHVWEAVSRYRTKAYETPLTSTRSRGTLHPARVRIRCRRRYGPSLECLTIGGIQAQVVYAGSAPSEIEGLFQVNAIVPAGIPTSDTVPVLLKVGRSKAR